MTSAPPDEHLALLIHLAAKRLRLEFARRSADFNLTPSTARGLAFLGRRPGASLTALAEALEVQPMSVVRVVDELEARGLLRREPDPRDRRALCLFLTPEGGSVVARIWETLDAIMAEACVAMTAQERTVLVRGLQSLTAGMERFGATEAAHG